MNDHADLVSPLAGLDAAFRTRRSVRGYLPRAVPQPLVEELLALAGRAPSGSNIQPWRVRVLAGEARQRVSAAIRAAVAEAGEAKPKAEWDYYPTSWREPFLGRRRKTGWGLYGALGIGKGDREAAEAFRLRNYDFFDAPVGMIFTLEADLSIGSWLDLGIFLGSLALAARGRGLDTCLQQSFADVHAVLHRELAIPPTEFVVCGMALGYADATAPQNQFTTEREPVHGFASFTGFDAPSDAAAPAAEALKPRLARIAAAYDAQGDHRTGSEVDARSADWLAGEVRAAGGAPALESFAFARVVPGPSAVLAGGRRIDGIPGFDAAGTGPSGIAGRLGPVGSDAEIGLVIRSQAGVGLSLKQELAQARASGHKGLVISIQGKRPGLSLVNATEFRQPLPIPLLQVPSEHGEFLAAQAAAGAPAELVVQASRVPAHGFNVLCRLPGADPALPPLVVSTPRSGWWNCASERSGGIACWLETLRALASRPRTRDCLFVAFSGHELDLLGVRHHLAAHPERVASTHLWLHFGANLGAPNRPMILQASDQAGHDRACAIARAAGAALDPAPWRDAVPRGEASVVRQHGIRFVAPVSGSDVFHHPADRWPAAVDIDALAICVATGQALAEAAAGP